MSIKKNFQEIVELLEKNKDKKVDTVLPQILELCTSKKKASTVRYDDNGNVTEIFCYYHKEWEPVSLYGKKSSSHTGYNTMCKEGVNNWTRQYSAYKKAQVALLDRVQKGELSVDKLEAERKRLEKERDKVVPRKEK